jgi:dihydroorotate dehydrogenase (fumarate)
MISKSCTLSPRNGNVEPRYYGWSEANIGVSINSMGIPNLGYQAYLDMGLTLKNVAPEKPFMLSVSGLSWDENEQILKSIRENQENERNDR